MEMRAVASLSASQMLEVDEEKEKEKESKKISWIISPYNRLLI